MIRPGDDAEPSDEEGPRQMIRVGDDADRSDEEEPRR